MIQKEENPWSEALVMVCTKCGKSISTLKESGEPAENLKMFLKKSLKDSGDGKKIRVVTSSCLDVCIDELQAVTVASNGEVQTYTLHPEKDKQEFLELLRKKL